jgi:hypothetical protein
MLQVGRKKTKNKDTSKAFSTAFETTLKAF